jgi:hypothetical protein
MKSSHGNCVYAIFLKDQLKYRLRGWLFSIALEHKNSSGERESTDNSRGDTTQSSWDKSSRSHFLPDPNPTSSTGVSVFPSALSVSIVLDPSTSSTYCIFPSSLPKNESSTSISTGVTPAFFITPFLFRPFLFYRL